MAIRLALLAHHYRSEWEWTDAELAAARERLDTWRRAFDRPTGPDPLPVIAAVRAALARDLDAPTALAAVDAWAGASGSVAGAGAGVADAVDTLLGVR
jgi:L-cysteine:1D-myo-inositol 2-amino-2-deoxy-alpha-D-glucopyranoside ligase